MISAFINAYNEENQLEDLFKSLTGIEDIVVINHNSTDKTAELAKKLGARVYTQSVLSDKATRKDVELFKSRYGFEPKFKAGEEIQNWAAEFNRSLKYCKNDWVLYIDCDERLKWDIDEIKKLCLTNDIIGCNLKTGYALGIPESTILAKKLFNRKKVSFSYRIHTIIETPGLREVFTDKMTISHYQENKDYRNSYCSICEYDFLKNQSPRMNFYLAREYFHDQEFEKALQFFKMFLSVTTDTVFIAKTYTLMSGCYWQLGDREKSYLYLFYAMRANPGYNQSFIMMAAITEVTNPEYAKVWRKIASILDQGSPL